jgi:hypothetical protein
MADASFSDGSERPLRLWATDAEDLRVASALCQDAILSAADMAWRPGAGPGGTGAFALLLRRFRWEDPARRAERVQCLATFREVEAVRRQGIDPRDRDAVLSLLSVTWEAGEDARGRAVLTFAGDGAVALDCACLDLTLADMSKPYQAPSGKRPSHPD